MDQVTFQVASGVLQPGDELPPTRTLSAQLGVNPMTISKAYGFLEKEGVVERRPGKPLVVRQLRQRELKVSRTELLRSSLASTITVIRQLDIDEEEALNLLRTMLREKGK
ncbi:MAG: GntR family transcriptional regulator [Gemmatimonadetes bacterium]|nr:GntR family transcriptional regulator [Gemmatimonadota bacterium]MBT4610761.1 GntR family transcriptional regulator [Gemmatimonadota bacterium]MBT5057716.1 GntR family transcriptional regulator [Gemmatimonadota bacterium]MBT5141372.1 GntR family transcriptional regulator [Gemmatimonadota bacterium]MBT5590453.1 GntR family transcriptional regulator [Gemmatimonadota bacterium]